MHPDIARARSEAIERDAALDGSGLQPQIEPYAEPGDVVETPEVPTQPVKRGRGRPRKDAAAPVPAKVVAKSAKLPEPKKTDKPKPAPIIEPVAPRPADQIFRHGAEFDWSNAPLAECSKRLKWLQDESARGVTTLAQRSPREDTFRCWCHSEHARDNGKRPVCFDPSHEKMGPDQKIARPVSIQTVRVRDFPGGQERLTNVYFATPICLAYFQKKVYGMRELPIMGGR